MIEAVKGLIKVPKRIIQTGYLQRKFGLSNLTLTHPRYDIFEDRFIGTAKKLEQQFFGKLLSDENKLAAFGQFVKKAKSSGTRVLVKLTENKDGTKIVKDRLTVTVSDAKNNTSREQLSAFESIFDESASLKDVWKSIKSVFSMGRTAEKLGKHTKSVVVDTKDRNAFVQMNTVLDELNAERKLAGNFRELAKVG